MCAGELVPPEKVHPRLFIGCATKFHRRGSCWAGVTYSESVSVSLQAAQREKRKEPTYDVNTSVSSRDPNPVCTSTVLERRKSLRLEQIDDQEEDEVVLKLPQQDDEIVLKFLQKVSSTAKRPKMSKPEKNKKIK
ncbi:hypothetical protein XELAEV_18044362mg [Xenopus laevis]|uniref:MKI67 FHA domain-containing protein n=1 Tax=Xenopus laevis TaxID=8355 RepID=A0A974BYN0_XENLA|nr:hypothetical protein XELAEV_18044362mg [Xenopus laevis]